MRTTTLRHLLAPATLILVALSTGAEAAGSVKAGREKARACQVCHGMDGRAQIPEAPNLAGQVENYLIAQLRAFRSGERKSEQMSVVVRTLTPQDIEDVAAYYAAIEIKVERMPGQ
jgi:cytochrome c553